MLLVLLVLLVLDAVEDAVEDEVDVEEVVVVEELVLVTVLELVELVVDEEVGRAVLEVEVVVGEHATLVLADLGDGRLEAGSVEQLVNEVVADPTVAPAGLPVGRVTASAYYAAEDAPADRERCGTPGLCPEGARPYVYEHADHLAVREAARALAPSSAQGSWLVTQPWDPAADVHLALPRDLYDAELAMGEGRPRQARRTGTYQRIYGWLAFPDVWRPGDLPVRGDKVFLPRIQSFEVVEP